MELATGTVVGGVMVLDLEVVSVMGLTGLLVDETFLQAEEINIIPQKQNMVTNFI
jgi:hypothetical protein